MRSSGLLDEPVRQLQQAGTLAEGEAALVSICEKLGDMRFVWISDVASPIPDAVTIELLRRQGWPEDVIYALQDNGIPLRMPVYIRSRFEHVPFVIALYDDHRRHRAPYQGDQKKSAELMFSSGFQSTLIVPLHLPRGRVALLAFASPLMIGEAKELLDLHAPALLAAGHYFARLVTEVTGSSEVAEEERARLTQREWDCLRLAAQGYREVEVAEMNEIAPTTVRYHLDNVVAKLGARNRPHAIAIATQLGLVGRLT